MECTSAHLVAGAVFPDNSFIRQARQPPFYFPRIYLNRSSGIALDGDGGCIVVFDSGNSRIQVLQYNNGRHVRSHGSCGSLPGQFRGIGCISFDSERENLVVADGDNHRVQVLRCAEHARDAFRLSAL